MWTYPTVVVSTAVPPTGLGIVFLRIVIAGESFESLSFPLSLISLSLSLPMYGSQDPTYPIQLYPRKLFKTTILSTCNNGVWDCSTREDCTDVCYVNSFGHYWTFDDTEYDFYGACSYTLVIKQRILVPDWLITSHVT